MTAIAAFVLLCLVALAAFAFAAVIAWNTYAGDLTDYEAYIFAAAFAFVGAVQILAAWLIWPLTGWG